MRLLSFHTSLISSVTQTRVEIGLQSLFDLTLVHLVQRADVLLPPNIVGPYHGVLLYKWGMDGASGQSQYNQELTGSNHHFIFNLKSKE